MSGEGITRSYRFTSVRAEGEGEWITADDDCVQAGADSSEWITHPDDVNTGDEAAMLARFDSMLLDSNLSHSNPNPNPNPNPRTLRPILLLILTLEGDLYCGTSCCSSVVYYTHNL